MKKPVLKQYLIDFYSKHKDTKLLLSKEEIVKLRKRNKFKFYFVDVFGHQSEYSDPNNQEALMYCMKDLVFGFKSGIVIGSSRVTDIVNEIYYDIKDKTYYSDLDHNSLSILRMSLKKEMFLHKELDTIFKTYYKEITKYNNYVKNQKIKKFKSTKQNLLKGLDNDGNGVIDIIEVNDDLKILLNKHQELIIETDKKYLHNLVKISNYLKDKRNNIQLIFENIRESDNSDDLQEYVGILKDEIHTYELLLLHSLSMIVSIKDKDLITFYEVYEQFDKLRIFESNWEKELSNNLKNVGDKMRELIYSIHEMNYEIVSKLNKLNYTTERSFVSLSNSINSELRSINSSVQANTLVNSINTYQTYKLRGR
tara:strand:+ start:284 stop:1384 length:1101 start_codon:yes stop_codon:yes gene_type:complete